jgi:septin family protein
MLDLINTTEESHYENYRQQQMETRKFGEPKVKKLDNPKFKEEEEGLRKRFTEQVKAEEARFRQWEQHVCLLVFNGSEAPLTCCGLAAHRRTRPPQQRP